METFNPKNIESRLFYRLLSGIVSPRPIALVSSCNAEGKVNLAPFSFFNVVSINPPVLVFSPLRRLRANTTKDTLNNVQACAEVVINIVGYDNVEQLSLTGNDYDPEVNEFDKAGFTPEKSTMVKPPIVAEALASFECKVTSIIPLGEEGGAGNLVVCEVVNAHFKNGLVNKEYQVDVTALELISRLGQDYYAKVDKAALFQIEKLSEILGIGWEKLPKEISENNYLTGNEIAKLAGVPIIPVTLSEVSISSDLKVYAQVKRLLVENKISEAWKKLYS
jgi:flavin reductase (DIM6/NTAB) family NADH-FMN oxidoreductase RutF